MSAVEASPMTERSEWACSMRRLFSLPEMLEADGRVCQAYFKAKRLKPAARKWGKLEARRLREAVHTHGIGQWALLEAHVASDWTANEIKAKCARLLGRQSLVEYVARRWKGDDVSIEAEYSRNKAIGRALGCWKSGMLVNDNAGLCLYFLANAPYEPRKLRSFLADYLAGTLALPDSLPTEYDFKASVVTTSSLEEDETGVEATEDSYAASKSGKSERKDIYARWRGSSEEKRSVFEFGKQSKGAHAVRSSDYLSNDTSAALSCIKTSRTAVSRSKAAADSMEVEPPVAERAICLPPRNESRTNHEEESFSAALFFDTPAEGHIPDFPLLNHTVYKWDSEDFLEGVVVALGAGKHSYKVRWSTGDEGTATFLPANLTLNVDNKERWWCEGIARSDLESERGGEAETSDKRPSKRLRAISMPL